MLYEKTNGIYIFGIVFRKHKDALVCKLEVYMDCVYELISTVVPNITSDEIVASVGIANYLRMFNYSGISFHIVDGRGIGDPIEVLNLLKIPYQCISYDKIFEQTKCDDLMFFCAKDLLNRIKTVNPKVKQLLFFYTGFLVKNINKDSISLQICMDDNEYTIAREDLEKLTRIKTYPLSYPCQLVKVQTQNYKIEEELRYNLINNSVNSFLDCTEDSPSEIHGRFMYDSLICVLREYIDNNVNYITNVNIELLKHKLFSASLNAGTVGLYRREFANAINMFYDLTRKKSIMANFIKSATIWRELGKRAMNQVSNNLLNNEYLAFAIPAINEIKKLEVYAMLEFQDVLNNRK